MVAGQGHRGRRGDHARVMLLQDTTLPTERLLLQADRQVACRHSRGQPREQNPSKRAFRSRPLT
eukprot:7387280-Prymnesium_polylepis.2